MTLPEMQQNIKPLTCRRCGQRYSMARMMIHLREHDEEKEEELHSNDLVSEEDVSLEKYNPTT